MELFKHQRQGADFLQEKKKAILADEMGLGKTIQAIVAEYEESAKTGEIPNAIVVCPASIKINWQREIRAFKPRARVNILSTTEDDPEPGPGWYIVNYDILEKKMPVIERLIEGGLNSLILDEGHYIKGKSLRAACIIGGTFKPKGGTKAKHPGIAARMKRVYVLTGTPLLNRPIEMFNLLRAIGHELGKNRTWFAKRYCGAYFKQIYRRNAPPIGYMDESGATNLPELARMMEGSMLRRKKKDVLDLPAKIVSIMECEMSAEWQKKYDTAWDDYLAFLKGQPVMDEEAFKKKMDNTLMARQLVEIQKLKQILSLSKMERMASDIRNAVAEEQKVIVFSQYTETIRRLAEELRAKPPGDRPFKVVTLTGADDMNERQKAVDAFQKDPFTMVFIANIKAGGVGLTLTEGSIVMFADMDWSPEIHAQAEDRAHRIGQAGTVNVYYYVAMGTIEDDIVRILNEKKDVMDQLLEGKKTKRKSETMQEAFLKLMAEKGWDGDNS